ncbi:MAG: hypothetical protein KKB30_00965 [Proteobacteria bacterium]|nr:hypothetical protein [Pseudomonadota bacterium]MBU1715383.1 hypothetical protein [Pseudomonadota bacterium]
MTINKFITTDKLAEYLDAELCSLLNDHEIYEISQYGWVEDDSPDPDYLGHALWQSPLTVNVSSSVSIAGDISLVSLSPEKKVRLREIGADFEGLMKTARISLGMSLLQKDIPGVNDCNDDFMFRLHHADSVWKLGMASWKLRDFWLVNLDCDSDESFQINHSGKSCAMQYCDPFFKADEILGERLADGQSHLAKSVDFLMPLIAHIASLLGVSVGVAQEEDCMAGYWEHPANNLRRIPSEEILSPAMAMAEITNWYMCLVEASNYLFLIEYFLGAEQNKVVVFGTGQVQHMLTD